MNFIFKILLVVMPMTLSQLVYFQIDKRFEITSKLSSKMKADKKWQPSFIVFFSFSSIVLLDIILMSITDVSYIVYYIFNGLLFGVSIAFSTNLSNQNKNEGI